MKNRIKYDSVRLHTRFAFFALCLLSLIVASQRAVLRTASAQSLAIVSAASYNGASLAADQIVAAFGSNLAVATMVASTQPLPTLLNGTSVKVRDSAGTERLAPLFFVSPTQINFQIPTGTVAGTAIITIIKNTATAASGNFTIAATAPSLFTSDASGKGLAAASALRIKPSNAQSYETVGRFDPQQSKFVATPIDLTIAGDQVFLILYGTGFRNRANLAQVTATVGGVAAEVGFAGPQGSFAGLDQINVKLPSGIASGELEVIVSVAGQPSNTVKVAVTVPVGGSETMYLANLRAESAAMSPASGYGTFRLSGDEKSGVFRFNYTNLTTPEVSEHIHGPADPGQNGPILFDLDTEPKDADGSYTWTFKQIGATTVAQIVAALKSGRLYVNIHSSRYPAGEIRGHFGLLNGSQNFTPPAAPPALPGGNPTARDAARFLAQTTFGPKAAEIAALQTKGFNTWLNEQFAAAQAAHLAYLDVALAGKVDPYEQEMMESFWKQAVTGPDQLRQRVAFALSEIFVVSFNSDLSSDPFALAGYLDTLGKDAFGNFRQLLEDITLNPAMGRYLNMVQNDKEDATTGRNPNENYAREILQLFSIGLYQLHPDGTLKLGPTGLPIDTYNQDVIKGFASAFTGWSYGWFPVTEQNWKYPKTYQNGNAFWRVPMQPWPTHHSALAKTLLNDATLPAGQTPQQDLKGALDNIFNHPNVGPFIARQLIQKLVTSNPSPAYVYRVVQKFNDNGSGVRGDMKAVLRAILLDYEARSVDVIGNQGYGKMREPVVRFANLLRTFNYSCTCGTFPIYWMDSPEYAIGQNPLRAPTVFNFFEPGYSHPGAIASAGLQSPEFQITTDTSVIGISDFFHYVARDGFKWETDKPLVPNYAEFNALAGNVTNLIDQLNLVLTAGGMSATLRTSLITEVTKIPASDPQKRVATAVHLIMTSPDYVIQK